MSAQNQPKRKRDITCAADVETNKKRRTEADDALLRTVAPENELRPPVARQSRTDIAAAKQGDDRPFAIYKTANVGLDLGELVKTRLSQGTFGCE